MKKLLLLGVLLFSTQIYSQFADRVTAAVFPAVNDASPTYLLGLKITPLNQFKVIPASSITWNTSQINGFNLAVTTIGDTRYPVSNGTNLEYIAGDGTKITFPTNLSTFTNGPGYLTSEIDPTIPSYSKSLTGFSVIKTDTDLLYYPLVGNPSGFLTSFIETDPHFNTKFATKTTDNLVEGSSNLYYTTSRFDTRFASKSTSDLIEGINLYYTTTRFNTDFTGRTTTNLTEGSNLYYTDTRARNALSLTTTGQTGVSTYSAGVFNIPNYTVTAGTGISVSSNVITNTAPDQTIVLTGSNGITTSGTYPNFTIAKTKKQETLTANTNASGIATFTFVNTYSVAPNIQYQMGFGATVKETIVPNSAPTTTGATYLVQVRNDVLGLLPTYSNVSGREVNILITEK